MLRYGILVIIYGCTCYNISDIITYFPPTDVLMKTSTVLDILLSIFLLRIVHKFYSIINCFEGKSNENEYPEGFSKELTVDIPIIHQYVHALAVKSKVWSLQDYALVLMSDYESIGGLYICLQLVGSLHFPPYY